MGDFLYQLAEGGHLTPFEKSALHFLVECDVATHIQLLKHRIGVSVNAESARYREFKEDRFYLPTDWPVADQVALAVHTRQAFRLYHETIERLVKAGFPRKRAKESARFFLPYATVTSADVQFNFRSFVHFLGLRMADDAQKEIREMATVMLDLVRSTGQFRLSLEAFGL